MLRITEGLFRGACFPLTPDETTIGRQASCDVRLPDNAVSRRHARIVRTAEGHVLIDLGSLNGTTVNGQRIQGAHLLAEGDVIGIGDARIAYHPSRPTQEEGAHKSRSQLETLAHFQAQVENVESWETVTQLLCQAVARLIGGKAQAAQIEHGQFVPFVASVFDTLHPLPELAEIREALSTGEPVQTNGTCAFVPLRHRTVPIRGVQVIKPGYTASDLDMVKRAIEVVLRTPAFSRAEEPGSTVVSSDDPLSKRIVGKSDAVQRVITEIRRAASTSVPVLILGESGTGKELVARSVHEEGSRARRPYVAFNCATLSPSLVDAQLFGHEKGAFTGATDRRAGLFEEAADGTIFLDEVGELPLEAQAKLLRILDTGEFRRLGANRVLQARSRIVCATNRDLERMADQGAFRLDLYYRIAGHVIVLPPLRERPGDISFLLDHFLAAVERETGTSGTRLSDAAVRTLLVQRWPGNVRELEMLVRRLAYLHPGEEIGVSDLPGARTATPDAGHVQPLRDRERAYILNALEACHGNKVHAARALGISRATLYKKLRKYGLEDYGPS